MNDFFGRAIKGMRLARLDLRNIEVNQPQSALPDIKFTATQTPRFALCGRVNASFSSVDDGAGEITKIAWPTPRLHKSAWPAIELRLSLWPENGVIIAHDQTAQDGWSEPATITLKAKATAPSLFYAKDEQGSVWDKFALTIVHDRETYSGQSPQFCLFRLTQTPDSKNEILSGRLGNLQFKTEQDVAVTAEGDESHYSHWRFSPRILEVPTGNQWRAYRATNTDLRLRFSLVDILPVGTDIPWADRTDRPRPLLIDASAAESHAKFILDLRETVSPTSDRQLLATVLDHTEDSADTATSAYAVISEEPFSIVKFRSQRLQARGSQETAAVASYDSDRRTWEFKLTSPTYHYEYPPQVVGESMDKPGRLEIHDPGPDDVDIAWPRPYHPDEGNDGVLLRRAVEFRLTPSSELWVRPSDVGRGYFLPEWAAYEIFRQRGEFGLGAAMEAFRGEFLYGLTVGIDTSREDGRSRGARVAEIEALTGRPLRGFRASNPDDKLNKRWTGLTRSLARRPERLEVWARDLDTNAPFGRARFQTGVRFALRNTAVHRHALKSLEDAGAPSINNPMRSGGPRARTHGISGGALWPIESANFYRMILANPASNGGSIERIALSPGGGDANQKAEFLKGQLSIISETRDGFVQRHQVEIVGRIAGFWHRAKHVVVYARTSSPSAQFTPEGGIGTRTRRPVLRKVSEYIELLQPSREYPDFVTAKASSSGFLKAVRFNSNIINVDSSWSEDVGNYGWKIPLWNRDSARMRPQVYPMPDIGFVTAAAGEGEQPSATQGCLDPDRIYFFADSEIGGTDTDAWPSRVGVDCVDLPAPRAEFEANGPVENETGQGRRPSTLRVVRGHQRFTWRLAPASRRTALNAERAGQPVYAGLESVTFMRSSPVAEADDTLALAIKSAAKLSAAADRLPFWLPDGSAPDELAELGRTLAEFRAAAVSGDDDQVRQAANALLAETTGVPGKLSGDLAKYVDGVKGYRNSLAGLHNGFAGLVEGTPSRCKLLVDDFAGSVRRKQLLVLDAVRSWEAMLLEYMDVEVHDHFNSKAELVTKLTEIVKRVIRRAIHDFAPDVGHVKNSAEKARNIIRAIEQDIDRVLYKSLADIDAAKQSYDRAKPWSPARLAEFEQQLANVRDGIETEILTAVGEARARLATELDQLANLLGRRLSIALQSLVEGEESLRASLGFGEGAAKSFLLGVDWKLRQALGENGGRDLFADLDRRLDDAIEKLSEAVHKAILAEIKNRLSTLKSDVERLSQGLRDLAEAAGAKLEDLKTAIATVSAEFKQLIGLAAAFTTHARTEIDKIVEDGFDEVKQGLFAGIAEIAAAAEKPLTAIADLGELVDPAVGRAAQEIRDTIVVTKGKIASLFVVLDGALTAVDAKLEAIQQKLSPSAVTDLVIGQVVKPAIEDLLAGIDFEKFRVITDESLNELRNLLHSTSFYVEQRFNALSATAFNEVQTEATKLCNLLGGTLEDAYIFFAEPVRALTEEMEAITAQLTAVLGDAQKLRDLAYGLGEEIRDFSNGLANSYAQAGAYADRLLDAAGNIDKGGIASVPNNILRLYAAVASVPELPNLSFDRGRLGYYYDALNDIIDTTPAEAWFGKLGDELKALGLSLPFDKIGDRLIPTDLSRFDISRIFRNFGGLKLDSLFRGYKLPAEARDAIKVTHAFDKREFRAWVQIDVDLQIPERKALFSVGPFQLDFVESRLVGQVRLEASKDTDRVEQMGRASFNTNIEAVVSGQTMVALRKVAVIYDKSTGLNVQFDPKNIKLNRAFQFIQDTLGSIFGDELGGLKLIKSNGIPVGMEHEFSMPPISLMYATSGVSNIQISNYFSLVAYPDFVISNRFSLSKPELPFLFSIFIIGGTGYITVDTEYRPFSKELMVVVEAAAGGSAALGFSFGPISGAVFISLSVALAYRRIGKTSSGVTISLVLLVAGNVNVAGIVNIYIGLLLRMSYRDSGQIDATGTLTVTIRISRFFKITARANVNYKLRGGKSQTTTTVSAETQITDEQLSKAKEKADKFLAARG